MFLSRLTELIRLVFSVFSHGPMARMELKRRRFLSNLPLRRCHWFGGTCLKILQAETKCFWVQRDLRSFQNLEPIEGLFVAIPDSIDIRIVFPKPCPSFFWFYRRAFLRFYLRSFSMYVWETKTSWTTLERSLVGFVFFNFFWLIMIL